MKLIYLLTVALCVPITLQLKGMDTSDMRLIEAIQANNLTLAKQLINAKVDLNAQNFSKGTALINAVFYHDNIEIVQALIDAGATIDLKDSTGYTAFMRAALYGRLDLLPYFIKGGTNIDLQNNTGDTALTNAVLINDRKVMLALIHAGANLNIRNNKGYTPLIAAAYCTYTHLVQPLITAGAHLNVQDNTGNTALFYAASNPRYNPLSTHLTQALIDAQPDLDVQNNAGTTAIMTAAVSSIADVQIFIDAGAKLYLKNTKDQTALDIAQQANNMQGYTHLQQAQALTDHVFQLLTTPVPSKDIKLTNPEAYSKQVLELQKAMQQLKELARHSVVVNLVNADGNRPLHAALIAQNKYMVQLVVKLMLQAKRGESILQANNNGHTPVHLAVGQSPELWLRLLSNFMYPKAQINPL